MIDNKDYGQKKYEVQSAKPLFGIDLGHGKY